MRSRPCPHRAPRFRPLGPGNSGMIVLELALGPAWHPTLHRSNAVSCSLGAARNTIKMAISGWRSPLILISLMISAIGIGLTYFDLGSRLTRASVAGSKPETLLLSEDPLVVYIKDFISPSEAAHLVHLA